jgi:hypothetical protein
VAPRTSSPPTSLGSAPLPWYGAAVKFPADDTANAIRDRVLALVRERSGNDAAEARVVIAADLVVAMLTAADGRGDLGVFERGLIRDGIRSDATAMVEELTRRPVTAYLTTHHHEPHLALLIFYLAPAPLRIA